MMLDGLETADRTHVVALGISTEGVKIPLGLWEGSTENATLVSMLLADVVDRGLDPEQAILFVLAQPLGVFDVRLATGNLFDVASIDQQTLELVLQDRPVGSDRGAPPSFRMVRFPGPPSEPVMWNST